MASDGIIKLREICRTFVVGGRPVHALVDVDEDIGEGEHVALMGPSGSGKSTMLNIIGCLDRPTAGSYQLSGREVGELDDQALSDIRRHEIGFVFQSYHLVPRLDATANIELPMVFAGIPRAERRRRVAEGGRVWEIDDFHDRDLVLAEVELPAVDVAVELPRWLADAVVREVTDDPSFTNLALAR